MNYLGYINGTAFGIQFSPVFLLVLVLVVIWSAIWKGIALWKSARNNHLAWFIVLLVVNTLGILEILYIFFFQYCCRGKNTARKKRSRR